MRQRAEQINGQRLSSREHDGFLALQRQVAQTLVQGFQQDRQAPDARHAQYGEHLATLQRHPNSASVSRVVLGLIPQRERLPLQRAVDEVLQRRTEQNGYEQVALQRQTLQRKKAELDEEALQPVLQRIAAKRGAGNPLPAAIQRHLEQGLNHDLSRVRIHNDAEANKLSKSVNALAFTTGTDIFFQSGQFNPNTQSGLELLAHEVTHAVQQSQGRVGTGVDPDGGLEAEARSMGAKLSAGSVQGKAKLSAPQAPLTPVAPQGPTRIQRRAAAEAAPSALAVSAAQVLNAIRTAPTVKMALTQLSEERRNQLMLNATMDLQSVVVVLTNKVGYGSLDSAYRLTTKRTLLQDFGSQLTALDVSRSEMRLTSPQRAGLLSTMIEEHDRSLWMVGNDALDRFGKTDNLLSNPLMGTTRQLGKPAVQLPGPVGAVLSRVRPVGGALGNIEVDRYEVITDPKVVEALVKELRQVKATGALPKVVAAYEQQTGKSLYATLGEKIRSPELRQKVLSILPLPISEQQLTFDAFLEDVAIGMVYDEAAGEALEGKAPHEDARRGGQPAPLLAYFGYKASDVIAGKWGLEFRILTPIPGKAKSKDVIVAWRGTEGVAFNLGSNKPGTVDTKIGDFAPGSIGYYQILQNKAIIDHQLAKAHAHGPLLMLGHSLGGGLAQLAATMYPQYTRTVVTFQGANIDQKDIDRLVKYNQNNPALAITARHYRADGDVVPTSGDAAVPGQIHYFDPQWKPENSNQAFGSTIADRASKGHNIPLLNTYLQGLSTKNPALNLLKAAGIQDENGQPKFANGKARPQNEQLDARVVYGGKYTTANDPRMVTEGGRDNALNWQKIATASRIPMLRSVGFRDLLTDELPVNTLLDHLTTLARNSASYTAFIKSALKLMALEDKTYGPITLSVTQKDQEMGKAMGMKLPETIQIPVQEMRAFVPAEQLRSGQFIQLKAIWAGIKG
ncbi:DUF4157 domain-containing protein [Deinococcus sp. Arct2-2]|uniref:eCIS core domain-containing protein n=1 Tax=Deinococcus sp. Arct2-2 TaxID=2568653 RepID=UPI001F0E01C3|nr:DUF4157 domain-containing protein [Deinococcus sp. Arct2-2]